MSAIPQLIRYGGRLAPGQTEPRNGFQARRVDLDLTQEEVGRLVGRSGRYVGLVETGKLPPPPPMVARFALALHCTQEQIREWLNISEASAVAG